MSKLANLPKKYLIKGIKDNTHTQTTLLATSAENAKEQSLKNGIYPLEIKKLSGFEFLQLQYFKLNNGIQRQDIASLFLQISIMLNANLPILEIMEVCAKNTKKSAFKSILLEIAYRLSLGQKLSLAFKEYEHIFGHLSWNLISLGEQSGQLEEVFALLYQNINQAHKNKSKIKRVLAYPLIVLVSMIIAFFGIVLFVIPEFSSLFKELDTNLPFITQTLISAESFLHSFGLILLFIIFIAIILVIYAYKNLAYFTYLVHKWILRLPYIGGILKSSILHNYIFSLYLALKSNISLDNALSLSNECVGNLYLKQKCILVLDSVSNGKSFSLALSQQNIIDDIEMALISAGERSGALPLMLEKCANNFALNSQEKIDLLISLIEPILSMLMGILILLLALGVFMPMWDISSNAINGI